MTRVALFLAGLAGIFVAALALGNVVDVEARTLEAEPTHGEAMSAPAGLAVEQDGYRLVHERDTFTAGRSRTTTFASSGRTARPCATSTSSTSGCCT